MQDDSPFEKHIEHLFGEPTGIANFLTINGKNGWDFSFMPSIKIVQSLVVWGKHEILSDLLKGRMGRRLVVDKHDIADGWRLVRIAALSKCIITTKEMLDSIGKPQERETAKRARTSLDGIAKNQDLGKPVNCFAKRQLELLELRAKTPSKMRWLNGTGKFQAYWGSWFRAHSTLRQIRMPQRASPSRIRVRA